MEEIQILQGEPLSRVQAAEQMSQVDIAKKYPRDVVAIKKRLLDYAGSDQATAKDCFYAKPVDDKGKLAEGPSIRLAEIMTAIYQNIRYGSRVIEISSDWVTVQGFCIDVESNNAFMFDEKRSIRKKNGHKYSDSMIQTTIKAASAIAIRNAVFKIVPPALFSNEVKKIKQIATGILDPGGKKPAKVKSIYDRFNDAIKVFDRLGVTESRILSTLKLKSKSDVTEDHLENLIGLHTAIKDNETTIEEAFPPTNKEDKQEKGKKAVDGTKDMFN